MSQDLRQKVNLLDIELHEFTNVPGKFDFPIEPGRSASIVDQFRGQKEKLSTPAGQARLLHELCNIELQAMELALRTYLEFPEAPVEFRKELAILTKQEGGHLILCLNELESRGYRFGHWPIHLQLWKAVSLEDSLLDRLLIVHRYLEGSGLDSGAKILKRLKGVGDWRLNCIVDQIHQDEIEHVRFGCRWYQEIAKSLNLDPEIDFINRMNHLFERLPKRLEKFDENLRRDVGFSSLEVEHLKSIQKLQLSQLSNCLAPIEGSSFSSTESNS
jgi:uncharacterized ferritin-like protein (DUF455 family)